MNKTKKSYGLPYMGSKRKIVKEINNTYSSTNNSKKVVEYLYYK